MQVLDELEYISLKGDRYLCHSWRFFDDITVNKKVAQLSLVIEFIVGFWV